MTEKLRQENSRRRPPRDGALRVSKQAMRKNLQVSSSGLHGTRGREGLLIEQGWRLLLEQATVAAELTLHDRMPALGRLLAELRDRQIEASHNGVPVTALAADRARLDKEISSLTRFFSQQWHTALESSSS